MKIKIPAGIDNGQSIRLAGYGGAGIHGAPDGDLYVRVRVRKDLRFEREKYDIKSEVYITFTQAILGDKISVDTVEGSLKLKIPPGTDSHTVFRLRGKGVPKLHSRARGDHYVTVKIKTPKNLNRKQKQIIKELNL